VGDSGDSECCASTDDRGRSRWGPSDWPSTCRKYMHGDTESRYVRKIRREETGISNSNTWLKINALLGSTV
jgi:hypothetical protein